MLDDPLALGILLVAGIAAGFVNTMAGGGSMLTLPALMLLGLPADAANGTNRVAVVAQTLAGLAGYQRAGKLDLVALPKLAVPTVLGAALGAYASAELIPKSLLEPVLLGTMLVMAIVMLLRPKTLAPEGEVRALRSTPVAVVGLFLAGVYGGFVQAGVGLVLLAVLAGTLRYDLVRANALKLALVLVFGAVSLGIFVWAGQVRWIEGGTLAAATMVGAWLGVRFAIRVDPRILRFIVVAAVVTSSVAALAR